MKKLQPMLIALALCARADMIELKSGERMEGTFKQATSAGVVIEVGGQPITMPLAKVAAIYFGTAQPAVLPGARESLDALMELRSVATSGINYPDYAARVQDVKVRVDRNLRGLNASPSKDAIGVAMRSYELASQAWILNTSRLNVEGLALSKSIEQELRSEPFRSCPALQELITNTDGNKRTKGLLPFFAGQKPGVLWSCASAKISEAERMLK